MNPPDMRVSGRPGGVWVLVALPWSWFALRDVLGVGGDVVAILLPAIVVVLAGIGILTAGCLRRWRWLLPVASLLAMGTVAVLGPWLPADAGAVAPGVATTIVAANVRGSVRPDGSLLARSPDVVSIAETPDRLDPVLAADHPYHHLVPGGPSIGLYSRLPFRVLEEPGPDLPGLRVQVDGPAGPFVLYALHVPRPWYTTEGGYQATVAEHHAIMDALAVRVAAETLPVVVVGDLNSPDRGGDYRRLIDRAGMVDAARADLTTFTSTGRWTPLLLRIDHVLVTAGWCGDAAGQLDLPGSDHRGVGATIGPCVGSDP